ncbi:hypothetical protein BEN78_13230 [Xanthomonas citri pv. mangiferaeindicae]|nr:hypothetical protein BEN78_13230 [Xanthomonas citri pv. mangiferaeindicae]
MNAAPSHPDNTRRRSVATVANVRRKETTMSPNNQNQREGQNQNPQQGGREQRQDDNQREPGQPGQSEEEE